MENINYQIIANSAIDIVVEPGLLSCIGEWRPLAHRLSKDHGVLLYERFGTGKSSEPITLRTPENIAKELCVLLGHVPHAQKLILVAHSQGGLYAQQFARMYPEAVRGIVFLDPLSANDNDFKTRLSEKEFRQSGADKLSALGLQRLLASMHLGFVIKALLKKAPPMCYYDFSAEDRAYILSCLARAAACSTAVREYRLAHDEKYIAPLKNAGGFPDIPVVLVTHSSRLMEKEIMRYGGAQGPAAERIEALWQSLMGEYAELSSRKRWLRADGSTHYIHLTEPQLVERAVGLIDEL